MLNVCFGDSEFGVLSMALGKKSVVCSYRDLDQGKLSIEEFDLARKEWCDRFFSACSKRTRKKILAERNKSFRRILQAAFAGEEICIWHASASYSVAGFYHTVFSLQGINCAIYHVELPDDIFGENEAHRQHAWAEISPFNIEKFLPLKKFLSTEERNDIAEKWRTLCEENAALRINLCGTLTSAPESCFDEFILDLAPVGTYKLANHLAKCLVGIPFCLGDGFYAQRIEALVEQGKLEVVERAKKPLEYYSKTYLRSTNTKKDNEAFDLVMDYLERTKFGLVEGAPALDDYNLQKSYDLISHNPDIPKHEFAQRMGIPYDEEEIAFDLFLSRLLLGPKLKEQVYVRKYKKALQLFRERPDVTKEEFIRILKLKKNPHYLFYRSRIY